MNDWFQDLDRETFCNSPIFLCFYLFTLLYNSFQLFYFAISFYTLIHSLMLLNCFFKLYFVSILHEKFSSLDSETVRNKLLPVLRQISDLSYELTKTLHLATSPQLFHSKLKTLLFNKSYPDSSSSPYLPPCLNSKHHPP